MKQNSLYNIKKFKSLNIAIVGDLMLDKYIFGNVERISPEAPIPIVAVTNEKYFPGGAANVAANISTLGGKANLYGLIGLDTPGELLLGCCDHFGIKHDGVIADKKLNTIQKIRIVAHHQQLLRIDYEDLKTGIENNTRQFLLKILKEKKLNAIIVSDYAKGCINMPLMTELKILASKKKIPLLVDPKPPHKNLYRDVFLVTPNKKEAEEMSGMKINNNSDAIHCGKKIMEELNCNVIITRGEQGMSVFEKGKQPQHIPTNAQEVYDVSGAGDTVIATLCLAICSGFTLYDAAVLANIAAGIKVAKAGTSPVTFEELKKCKA